MHFTQTTARIGRICSTQQCRIGKSERPLWRPFCAEHDEVAGKRQSSAATCPPDELGHCRRVRLARDQLRSVHAVDDHAHRKPWPDRQRRLDFEVATDDLLAARVDALGRALTQSLDRGALVGVRARAGQDVLGGVQLPGRKDGSAPAARSRPELFPKAGLGASRSRTGPELSLQAPPRAYATVKRLDYGDGIVTNASAPGKTRRARGDASTTSVGFASEHLAAMGDALISKSTGRLQPPSARTEGPLRFRQCGLAEMALPLLRVKARRSYSAAELRQHFARPPSSSRFNPEHRREVSSSLWSSG